MLDYSTKEKEVAEWLEKTFGGKIYLLPRINKPEGIKTADFLFRNEKWDLKEIHGRGKRIIEDTVKNKKQQAHNFIFDISKTDIKKEDLFKQFEKLYTSKSTNWINKIIIKEKEKLIFVFERKKETDRNPTGHDQSH